MRGRQPEQVALRLVSQHLDHIGQMLAFGRQFDDGFVGYTLNWHSLWNGGSTVLQALDPVPGVPEFAAQFSLSGFKYAHRVALLARVGPRLPSLFSWESIKMRIGPTQLDVRGGPSRIGHFAAGVVRRCGIFGQRIQRILLAQVFEKVLLPPAIKHSIRYLSGGQIAA